MLITELCQSISRTGREYSTGQPAGQATTRTGQPALADHHRRGADQHGQSSLQRPTPGAGHGHPAGTPHTPPPGTQGGHPITPPYYMGDYFT